MGRKKGPLSFARKMVLPKRLTEMQPISPTANSSGISPHAHANPDGGNLGPPAPAAGGGSVPKGVKKKAGGSRLWMRFDRTGQTELLECDKNIIIQRASIPARDLRILGPVFSHSSNILAREKAMVINLEFVKAIITAQEVLLLDPLSHEVLPFVEQLRQQLSLKVSPKAHDSDTQGKEKGSPNDGQWLAVAGATESDQSELPFEFQVLEIALEVVCTYLESSVSDLEKDAYPCLDELAKNVSTKNLERVRGLKTNLTRLLARVQKVRDEIEHLLDDDEDMAHLYLTRKETQIQQLEALVGAGVSDNTTAVVPHLRRFNSYHGTASFINSLHSDDNDVEDLEMLLEAYFMQLDGTRNKILSVREYIDDTEDYVNIQLDNQRNELIQLQLTLTIASFAIALDTLIAGIFAMNIPSQLYQMKGIFGPFVGGTSSGCFVIFLLILSYARWKKLLGS